DTPAMVAALTLFQQWHPSPGARLTYQEARRQFRAGQVAMLIDGDWALPELTGTETLDWGVTLLPNLGPADNSQPAAPLVLARYWAINQATSGDRALAAAAFLEYITSPERQLAWTAQYGQLPTRREALNAPAIATDPRLRLSASQMLAGQTLPLSVDPNELFDSMRGPLREMLDGSMTPAEAAAAMQANLEK
ncbi:MAG: extracellular solute-binding protein, partial [Anaerolineae bacterium]|nr:extracellular solute-binding protein [Anaerolineae bacterium]